MHQSDRGKANLLHEHQPWVRPSQDFTCNSGTRWSYLVQPGFCGFLHQHWSNPFFWVRGICSLTSFVPHMDVGDNEAFSVYPGNPTIPVTWLKAAGSGSSTSQERLWLEMCRPSSERHWVQASSCDVGRIYLQCLWPNFSNLGCSYGTMARVTLLPCATPTSVTYFIPIGLSGVDSRTRAICFLPGLSLISTSRTSCAYLAIQPFLLDIYHRMLDRRRIPSTYVVLQFLFCFFLLPCCCLVCPRPISVSAFFSFPIWQRDSATANLASPRDLRMASKHETHVPMTLIRSLTHLEPPSEYTSHSVPTLL